MREIELNPRFSGPFTKLDDYLCDIRYYPDRGVSHHGWWNLANVDNSTNLIDWYEEGFYSRTDT